MTQHSKTRRLVRKPLKKYHRGNIIEYHKLLDIINHQMSQIIGYKDVTIKGLYLTNIG